MSTEPHPVKQSLLAGPLNAATRLVLRVPTLTVTLALALALASGWYTYRYLGYRTSRLDLLDPNSDYNRLWIEYIDEFGEDDDAVVVVEGPDRERVVPVLDEISRALSREDRLFHAVLHGVDLSKIRSKGLHYLSVDELLAIDRFLAEVEPVIAGGWQRLNVGNMVSVMTLRLEARLQAAQEPDPQTLNRVERLGESLLDVLSGHARYRSPWPAMPQSVATLSELNAEYLLTKEGRLGFVLLRLARDPDGFARCSRATDALRELLRQVNARHPNVTIGLTGLPVMENDEMRSSQSSMYSASVLSLIAVALLFVAGFGGVRHALLANLVLAVGIAWSFGYVTLVIGHLNILSMSFTVTLIGIGIDYGVYYVARYLQVRRDLHDCRAALLATTAAVGPAILTGAMTTSIAFFAAGLTSFVGVAELGKIAGGGILLCAAAELLVLPAVLYLVDRSRLGMQVPDPLPVHTWVRPLQRVPRLILAATLAVTLLFSSGMAKLWYDHNLLNLQAEGLESVELERKLLTESQQSCWYALSLADSREELLERKAKLMKLPSVEKTEEIVSLLPADADVKGPLIARIWERLARLPERPPLIPVDSPEALGQALAATQELLAAIPSAGRASRVYEQIRDALRRKPLADCYRLLSQFQQHMAGDLLSRLYALRSMADPQPPQLSDLPESLVNRFVGHNGKYLLKIYGRGNIWDMSALRQFVSEVRSVDPRATGNPLQAYEASLEMKRSYEHSALIALLVISVVLLADLRNLRHALLAGLPLGLSMVQTFGLLGWLNIPLNPANMIALPLILGIGIDYGVHLVHEYREQQGPYRISQGTAVAVLVDALTTIVGFGALMIASHRGLQSLGRVLTLGVTCCLLTSLVSLPALLAWISRKREPLQSQENSSMPTVLRRTERRGAPQRRKAASPGTSAGELPHNERQRMAGFFPGTSGGVSPRRAS